MRRFWSRPATATVVVLALLAPGCGNRIKLVPVEGVVTINGVPAPNLSVQFMPDALKKGTGPTSFAMTDAQGKFRLTAQTGADGAVVGQHRVVLVDLDEERPAQGVPMKRLPRLAPELAIATSALEVEVKEGGGPLEIKAYGPRR